VETPQSEQRLGAWGRGYAPETVNDQPDTSGTPTADNNAERDRALQQEAQELAADPADRAEVAELRSLLGEPWADLPA
jgi:hypothetical protein